MELGRMGERDCLERGSFGERERSGRVECLAQNLVLVFYCQSPVALMFVEDTP